MTKSEFISKQAAWKRYRDKIGFLYVVGFGLFFLWGNRLPHGTSPLFQVCGVIYFLGGLILIAWLNIRRQKQLGMFCRKCKWGKFFLFNPIATNKILTTGKCGRCGETIISE